MAHSLYCMKVTRERSGENITGRIELAKGLLEKKLMRGDIGVAQILSPDEMITGRLVEHNVVWSIVKFTDVPAFDSN